MANAVRVISPSWSDRLTEQRSPISSLTGEARLARAHEIVQPVPDKEAAVPEEWLRGFDAKKVDEYQERLRADAELLGVLQFGGFTGPAWDELATTFAEYGYQVVRGWLISGHIYVLCAQRRIALGIMFDDRRPVPREHQIADLTQDTVSLAIEKFREKVLIPRKWVPAGGASLKTYFIGQALFQFGDTFRYWALAERRQDRVAAGVGFDLTTHNASSTVVPGERLVHRELIARFARYMDEQTKAIVLLTAEGYEQPAIAEILGMSPRAVEGKLYRYRKRLEGRDAVA
jgi:DNA-directed RNA polymerase specialized sigma24 family protein